MKTWIKALLFVAVAVGGVLNIVIDDGSAYADKKYFEITVDKTSCTPITETVGPLNDVVSTGSNCNGAPTSSGKVQIIEDGDSYSLDGGSSHIVNDVTFTKQGNKKLSVSRNSAFVNSDHFSVAYPGNFDAFRLAVQATATMRTFDSSSIIFGASKITFKVGSMQTMSDDEAAAAIGGAAANNQQQQSGTATPNCMNSGGLNTLGWVLCPAMELLSSAAKGVYEQFVEPALQVDPVLFTNNGNGNGTEEAWSVFRDIANGLFIVLLLIVIFSQLTGVGIDNYGIKKVLPKMIVGAILINLSYWICVVFVDLSNILGNGLQTLFNNLPTGDVNAAASGMGIQGVGMGLLTAVVLAGGLVAAIFASGGGVALALTLLVSLIGVAVSIFFLFILLAAREAAIVVLTVISPVMVVCYMLPNTKSMFDKWLKFIWGLLLVYPVAGLLIGGGNFVSKLLLVAGAGAGGFFSAFVAMLAGIIPIFFIPTVLKNSLNAAGQLGAKISGMGQRVGGRLSSNTDRAIRGSERFKNYQSDRDRQRKIDAARRTAARYTDENGNIREGLSDRQRRRASQALLIQHDERQEELKRQNLLNGGYAAANARIETNAANEATENGLTLMQQNGIMMDGANEPVAATRDNMLARMAQLENKAQNQALTQQEEREVAVLARGLVNQRGGASRLNDLVRNAGADDGHGGKVLNTNFMQALGQAYNQDATVQSKMNEKDGTMQSYMEGFVPGGNGNQSYANAVTSGNVENRAQSYEARLNQGGQALTDAMTAGHANAFTRDDCQNIYDQGLEKVLDADDLARFKEYAERTYGITGKKASKISGEIGGQQTELTIEHGSGTT